MERNGEISCNYVITLFAGDFSTPFVARNDGSYLISYLNSDFSFSLKKYKTR